MTSERDVFQAVIDVYREDLEMALTRVQELETIFLTYKKFETERLLLQQLSIAVSALREIDNDVAKEALVKIGGVR
jgi:hypothetical protein